MGDFALINMCLAMVWLGIAYAVGRSFSEREEESGGNLPPRLSHTLEDQFLRPGVAFNFSLPDDTFVDPDEGDVLACTLAGVDGAAAPGWLQFDGEGLAFSGEAPLEPGTTVELVLRATDFDGAFAEGRFRLVVADSH